MLTDIISGTLSVCSWGGHMIDVKYAQNATKITQMRDYGYGNARKISHSSLDLSQILTHLQHHRGIPTIGLSQPHKHGFLNSYHNNYTFGIRVTAYYIHTLFEGSVFILWQCWKVTVLKSRCIHVTFTVNQK
ncbi:hypothetical protein AB6A40_009054 [Gnathostoma spinigerum]|uniref:Uncharacterized protein n=1 Tax=Gnathostoma spinigerum TaxID=75299 RepID=A0ABD6ES21_9BILA